MRCCWPGWRPRWPSGGPGGPAGGVLVELEGHGREPVSPDADVSRTVGWFTSHYPVRLDPGPGRFYRGMLAGAAAGALLKRVKEQLRGGARAGPGLWPAALPEPGGAGAGRARPTRRSASTISAGSAPGGRAGSRPTLEQAALAPGPGAAALGGAAARLPASARAGSLLARGPRPPGRPAAAAVAGLARRAAGRGGAAELARLGGRPCRPGWPRPPPARRRAATPHLTSPWSAWPGQSRYSKPAERWTAIRTGRAARRAAAVAAAGGAGVPRALSTRRAPTSTPCRCAGPRRPAGPGPAAGTRRRRCWSATPTCGPPSAAGPEPPGAGDRAPRRTALAGGRPVRAGQPRRRPRPALARPTGAAVRSGAAAAAAVACWSGWPGPAPAGDHQPSPADGRLVDAGPVAELAALYGRAGHRAGCRRWRRTGTTWPGWRARTGRGRRPRGRAALAGLERAHAGRPGTTGPEPRSAAACTWPPCCRRADRALRELARPGGDR